MKEWRVSLNLTTGPYVLGWTKNEDEARNLFDVMTNRMGSRGAITLRGSDENTVLISVEHIVTAHFETRETEKK